MIICSFVSVLDVEMANGFQLSQHQVPFLQAHPTHILHYLSIDPHHHLSFLHAHPHSPRPPSQHGWKVVETAVHHLEVVIEVRLQGGGGLWLPHWLWQVPPFHQEFSVFAAHAGFDDALHYVLHSNQHYRKYIKCRPNPTKPNLQKMHPLRFNPFLSPFLLSSSSSNVIVHFRRFPKQSLFLILQVYDFYQTQFYQLHTMMQRLAQGFIALSPRTMLKGCFSTAQKANSKDLYELLEVSRSANAKEIKKAYYKLAQEYHPDKNPSPEAKERFTRINNAYQILSDATKRQTYDQTGYTGEGSAAKHVNQGQGGFDPQDIFGQFRGYRPVYARGRNSQDREVEPTMINLSLTFQQSVKGCTKVVEYKKKVACSSCLGSRCKPGTQPEKCQSCDGQGMQTIQSGKLVIKKTCYECKGAGEKIKHFCPSCKGSGAEKKRVKEEVDIPRGISDGMNVKLSKKGNFDGDLFIKVQVKKSPVFAREGYNALSDLKISVLDAILGGEKQVETIEGGKQKVRIPRGVQDGQKITLKGQGFYLVDTANKGDHILTVKIEIPKSLTAEQRQIYEKLKALLG